MLSLILGFVSLAFYPYLRELIGEFCRRAETALRNVELT